MSADRWHLTLQTVSNALYITSLVPVSAVVALFLLLSKGFHRPVASHHGKLVKGKHSTFGCHQIKQGWRSGESTCLPPMWPGFDSRTRRHMWVEFVAGSRLYSERVFSGYPGFTLCSKTNISKFQFDIDAAVDEDPPFGYATANSTLIPIYFVYLFIYLC